MTHKIRYRRVNLPEVDSFLAEYNALCKRHGMKFSVEEYGYDGGSYVTLDVADGDSVPYLNLDEASQAIPCIARAREEVEAMHEAEARADEEKRAAALKKRNETLLRDGVIVAGKRYKLVDQED